jgi:hypothetical protein
VLMCDAWSLVITGLWRNRLQIWRVAENVLNN